MSTELKRNEQRRPIGELSRLKNSALIPHQSVLCFTLCALLLTLCSLLLAPCFQVHAQQPKKVPRVGFLASVGSPESPPIQLEILQQGLHDVGYIEGQNILFVTRYAEGRLDRIPALADELVQLKVDVIVVTNNVAIRAAKKGTKTIPIVMLSSIDPVAARYVDSLAQPGGNITGVANLSRELSAKRVEMLKEVLPKIRRPAILWDVDGPGTKVAFKEYQAAARAFELDLQSLEVRGPNPISKGHSKL